MIRHLYVILPILAVAIGLILGYVVFKPGNKSAAAASADVASEESEYDIQEQEWAQNKASGLIESPADVPLSAQTAFKTRKEERRYKPFGKVQIDEAAEDDATSPPITGLSQTGYSNMDTAATRNFPQYNLRWQPPMWDYTTAMSSNPVGNMTNAFYQKTTAICL